MKNQHSHCNFRITRTVSGIELARKNQLDLAIAKYNKAIQMDDTCVEALVARGAAYFSFNQICESEQVEREYQGSYIGCKIR
jgi:Flp pilus assembly protein TadD